MLFNSYVFLFLFLPAVLLVYYACPDSWRNFILTLAGYVFYGYWNVNFCGLLLLVTLWAFLFGKKIHQGRNRRHRQGYLLLSITLNLGMLAYFKYANFFLDSLLKIFPCLTFPELAIILPIGISFFTFQSMSYTIDIYQGKAKPIESVIDFACYIAMFPQLIAGPIVRYHEIAAQLINRQHSVTLFAHGVRRFILGLAKKVLIADVMAAIADPMLAITPATFCSSWIGIIAFSLQIYFDFSGYSDMAIGLGRMFGFHLPENFNFPYRSTGISDFWRRWHISLSRWLRDYLYIPLGGSRCGWKLYARNIVFTMTLCGLWHGAAWTYVTWGGYYGILLLMERPFRARFARIPSWLIIPATNLLVVIGWVFFRARTMGQAGEWLGAMAGFSPLSPMGQALPAPILLFLLFFLQSTCWLAKTPHISLRSAGPALDCGLALLLVICFVTIMGENVSQFLYYQF
jgi:alginate O-acetyltransferase complex protein AlgI